MQKINRSRRKIIKKGFQFRPFRPKPTDAIPLKESGLTDDSELILFERNGEKRALILQEMAYHHVAQGELGGEPYVITF